MIVFSSVVISTTFRSRSKFNRTPIFRLSSIPIRRRYAVPLFLSSQSVAPLGRHM